MDTVFMIIRLPPADWFAFKGRSLYFLIDIACKKGGMKNPLETLVKVIVFITCKDWNEKKVIGHHTKRMIYLNIARGLSIWDTNWLMYLRSLNGCICF